MPTNEIRLCVLLCLSHTATTVSLFSLISLIYASYIPHFAPPALHSRSHCSLGCFWIIVTGMHFVDFFLLVCCCFEKCLDSASSNRYDWDFRWLCYLISVYVFCVRSSPNVNNSQIKPQFNWNALIPLLFGCTNAMALHTGKEKWTENEAEKKPLLIKMIIETY